MPSAYILSRIAARTGVSVWRHRFAWLGATLAVTAFSLYELSYAGPSVVNGDCADTTMAAVTKVDDNMSRAAYACLGPTLRNTDEQGFIDNMHRRDTTTGRLTRVGEQHTSDGGLIVFYTVEGQGPAVGYIVYLNSQGKVIKVE
jgi:hypothetical protein